MSDVILEIKNITKKYGKKVIIDNLSLTVEKGQVYGFLGPNGAGKTTTIKMIVGLISLDSGEIKINGLDIVKHKEEAMKHIGAIVENPDLYEFLSGKENLKQFARVHNIKKERLEQVIELVDLKNRINDKVKKYSLGMKQRLGLAVALLHNPKLLILDEPTNGLDPAGIKKLRDTLKQLAHKENITVFVSSHLLSEVELMCDKVAIIDSGKIIKTEDLNTISTSNEYENKYIFEVSNIDKSIEILSEKYECALNNNKLVVKCDDKISNVILLLIKNEIEIISFFKKKDTLEEEFLKIAGGIK